MDRSWPLGKIQIPKHETVVGMDRHGELMRLVGGKHRLAIAQQIGIKKIPAVLSICHSDALDMLPTLKKPITGSPEDFRPFSKSEK